MDLTLSEDQTMLRDTVNRFAREVADPTRARDLETASPAFDRDLWEQLAEFGLAGAPFPERFGGAGVGLLEFGLVAEALGASAIASPLFAATAESGLLLADCAPDALQAEWLPAIAEGRKLLATAWLETRRSLDPTRIRARLDRATGRLNGRKLYVREARAADAIVCLVALDGGEQGLAIVDAADPGLTVAQMPASGGETLWAVEFDDVAVSQDAIITGNGIATAIDRLAQRGAALKACELTGIGQAALDLTVAYANERRQFGVPIGSFQAVQHHCAEMLRDIAITRLLSRQACARLDASGDARREVSFAKAKASTAVPAATRIAHQIHGAVAFYRDYPLELYYHRAIAAQAAYGDALHHRKILADMLASDPDRFRGDNRHEQ